MQKLYFMLIASLFSLPRAFAAEASPLKPAEFVLQTFHQNTGAAKAIGDKNSPVKIQRGRTGLNEILVAVPGFGIRKVRFWLKPGERQTLRVNLAKLKYSIEPEWASADKTIPASKTAKLPSFCLWYQEKTNDTSICRRSTLLEDLAFSEPTLYPVDDMRALASAKKLESYRELINQNLKNKSELEPRIEGLLQQFPENSALFQLAAAMALYRGDCPRIHSLFVEAQQVLESADPVVLYKAICLENQGQTEAATLLLQEVIKTKKSPAPYLSYHLGRIYLKNSPEKALELATNCAKKYRFDLSCQELGAMASKLSQKPFQTVRFNLEEATFKIYRNLEEGLSQGQAEAMFFKTIPFINAYPHSLEAYLFLAWIDAVQKIPGGIAFHTIKMQVGSPLGGSSLNIIIEGLENQNQTQLLTPVYRNKLRSETQDPNLWMRLVRAHAKADQCLEALQAAKDGEKILPKYNAQLLQIEANCLLQLNRLPAALVIYQKIIVVQPKNWATFYNIAAIYERMGQKTEAFDNYKLATQLNPPPEVNGGITAKLAELETSLNSQRSKNKPAQGL